VRACKAQPAVCACLLSRRCAMSSSCYWSIRMYSYRNQNILDRYESYEPYCSPNGHVLLFPAPRTILLQTITSPVAFARTRRITSTGECRRNAEYSTSVPVSTQLQTGARAILLCMHCTTCSCSILCVRGRGNGLKTYLWMFVCVMPRQSPGPSTSLHVVCGELVTGDPTPET
jgi:hypothetical protein